MPIPDFCFVRVLSLGLFLSGAGLNGEVKAGEPHRLKRSESFLGVHFDFHAGPDCKEIGKNTTREMIEDVISKVKPDYLQIDCKGHRGLSSYPTKVGNPAPGFVGGDPLRLWRQVTAEHGVSLYMHYSGVWDSEAILQHPDWGVVNADGKTNPNATSFFGPYAERLLIPQLRELAGDYGVDGAWVDGECWASVPDYNAAALDAFSRQTGIKDVPRKASDPHWYEFLQFNREAFRDYLRKYIASVKKTHPKFQLCSNWAYTDHMPEPVSAPVDFLSGDYSPQDSVNSARISARYLARQGQPWDLMAWSFTTKPGKDGATQKTTVQLQREAAVVLSLGGGFQAYFSQTRDGAIRSERMPVMGEVARFCRERQAVCHHATQVPQVALLYSTAAHYRRMNSLFGRDHSPFAGTLEALLESQFSVEVLGEHHLLRRMQQYPLIVIPEWQYLEPAFRQRLATYVKKGGNLLLIGDASTLFTSELGVEIERNPTSPPRYLDVRGTLVSIKGGAQKVKPSPDARVFGKLYAAYDTTSASSPAATITSLGKGKIAAAYFPFSRSYLDGQNPLAREYLEALVRQVFPQPIVEVLGSHDVDVVVNRTTAGKLSVNLVNTSGPHRTEPIIDSIRPVGPLELIIREKRKPTRITLEPAGHSLNFEQNAGTIRLTVPRVQVHEIVLLH